LGDAIQLQGERQNERLDERQGGDPNTIFEIQMQQSAVGDAATNEVVGDQDNEDGKECDAANEGQLLVLKIN
jgi:hypothetical protein